MSSEPFNSSPEARQQTLRRHWVLVRPTADPEQSACVTEATDTFSWEGSVLASSASVFWALLAVVVKLSPSLSTSKLMLHFSLGVFVGITACQTGVSVPYGPLSAQRMLLLRSVLVTSSVFARFFSLRYLSLVNGYALCNVGPALTLVPEYLVQGPEIISFGRVFAVGVMGIAVCLVVYTNLARDDDQAEDRNFNVGCALALASASLRAVVRELSSLSANTPSAMLIFHWSFVALLTSCTLAVWNGEIGSIFADSDMGALVFVAQVSFAFVYLVSKARECVNYGVVNVCLYSGDLVLAVVASLVYLREKARPLDYAAAVLVWVSVFSAEASMLGLGPHRLRAAWQRP
ncbi:unnamed protein product [Ixodes pacificus]